MQNLSKVSLSIELITFIIPPGRTHTRQKSLLILLHAYLYANLSRENISIIFMLIDDVLLIPSIAIEVHRIIWRYPN